MNMNPNQRTLTYTGKSCNQNLLLSKTVKENLTKAFAGTHSPKEFEHARKVLKENVSIASWQLLSGYDPDKNMECLSILHNSVHKCSMYRSDDRHLVCCKEDCEFHRDRADVIEAHFLHSKKHPPAFADRYEAAMDLWRLWQEGKLRKSDCRAPHISPLQKFKQTGMAKYDGKLRQNVLSEWEAESFDYLREHNQREKEIRGGQLLQAICLEPGGFYCISNMLRCPPFTIKRLQDWLRERHKLRFLQYMCPNPLRGERMQKGDAIRQDWLVLEDDKGSLDEQVVLLQWLAAQVEHPLKMMVWSGNRSIHGWWEIRGSDCEPLLNLARELQLDTSTYTEKFVRLPNGTNSKTREQQEILSVDWQWLLGRTNKGKKKGNR
jgi:hypothetical protein